MTKPKNSRSPKEKIDDLLDNLSLSGIPDFNVAKIALYVGGIVILLALIYVAYLQFEKYQDSQRAYLEGVLDTKIKALDSSIADKLDKIEVLHEQKTVIYKEINNVYQSTEAELSNIKELENKPMKEIVDAWNKNL